MDSTEKIQMLIAAAGELKPGVAHIEVKHDDDCPAIKTQKLVDCTCDPDFIMMKTEALRIPENTR
jgi:hypothetical protein